MCMSGYGIVAIGGTLILQGAYRWSLFSASSVCAADDLGQCHLAIDGTTVVEASHDLFLANPLRYLAF
jgi:hypothetical protein